jgi:hypothetical protein
MTHSHALMAVMPVAPLVVENDGHDWHVLLDTAASVLLYLSAKQMSHAADPVFALYFPAIHPLHAPPNPLFPVYPALHAQSVISSLPRGDPVLLAHGRQTLDTVALTVVEYVLIPQSVQMAEPVVVLYLPATHPKHATPF